MDSSEATLARERCELHPDRAAVGLCEGCGRTVCLECAIPFRGAIRCERCAALELGEPEPVPPGRGMRIRVEHIVIVLLLIALVATVPPWHRSGTLTTRLSAWIFGLDGWAALGCIALAAAAVLAVLALVHPTRSSRPLATACLLSASAALAIAVTLIRAPEFFSATPSPYLAIACALGAAVAGAFRLLRRSRI